jgi:hypothetical protein
VEVRVPTPTKVPVYIDIKAAPVVDKPKDDYKQKEEGNKKSG